MTSKAKPKTIAKTPKSHRIIGLAFRLISGLIIIAIITLTGLSQAHGTPPSDVVDKHTLAQAYLAKQRDSYGKCARSVAYGDIVVGDVVLEYNYIGISQTAYDHLQQVANDFKASVKQQCDQPIADYKRNYAAYEQTELQIAKDTQSVFDKILGNEPPSDTTSLRQYNPDTVKAMSGAVDDLIFTKTDVKQYLEAHL